MPGASVRCGRGIWSDMCYLSSMRCLKVRENRRLISKRRTTEVRVAKAVCSWFYKRLARLDPLSPKGREERRFRSERRRAPPGDPGGALPAPGGGPPPRGRGGERRRPRPHGARFE